MAPEITVAIIASIPGLAAAIGVLRSSNIKDTKEALLRIENKLDKHIDWHLSSCPVFKGNICDAGKDR